MGYNILMYLIRYSILMPLYSTHNMYCIIQCSMGIPSNNPAKPIGVKWEITLKSYELICMSRHMCTIGPIYYDTLRWEIMSSRR